MELTTAGAQEEQTELTGSDGRSSLRAMAHDLEDRGQATAESAFPISPGARKMRMRDRTAVAPGIQFSDTALLLTSAWAHVSIPISATLGFFFSR
jgi:hypothetical protein